MPVASARRCVAASRACEPRLARDALRAPRSTRVDRASRGPKRSREGLGALLDDVARALLVGASGTRVTGAPRRGAWIAPRRDAQAETHRGCRLAKGDTVGRIGVPSAAPESLRERKVVLACAPGPGPRYAASAEALLRSPRASFAAFAAPASDEASARSRLDPPNQRDRSPTGTARRSARYGFYDRFSSRADVPRTSCSLIPTNRPHRQ
jgi:hypothetical protein